MESFYLILVIALFALAISDLIVGVSNDAVNFLNSAIGSKAIPKWLIFSVAALGVLIGTTFSGGMMEVARKGIFHPQMFFFSEIMVIFLAVMITDVILLDMFNTFGLPTSTTVAIVFELLGAAVAVSIVKILGNDGSIVEVANYINSAKALAIISGILLSVVVAFSVGAIVQYLTRLVFSFRFEKRMKYYGALFGSFAITAILYFMLIKGMKGSVFASYDVGGGVTLKKWVTSHTFEILLYSFIGWTVIIQILKMLFKINIFRGIIVIGTFALAMAFAGNDLVNFIGVPLAGYNSYQAWIEAGSIAPDALSMESLQGKVPTPTFMLLIAGGIMVVTLILSRKARGVVKTSLDLSRQDEGSERFESSLLARVIVRQSLKFNKRLIQILPNSVNRYLESKFIQDKLDVAVKEEDRPAFDMVRASVNLTVASILIAIGTSLKLPLSTTYVTFMVAMGTSLADRAWDRESAVYRISGVFAVIGGWFMTAFLAFTAAAIVGTLIAAIGKAMVFVFIGVAVIVVFRTHLIYKKKENNNIEEEEFTEPQINTKKLLDKSLRNVELSLSNVSEIYSGAMEAFFTENDSKLKEMYEKTVEFTEKTKRRKAKVHSAITKLQQDSMESGHFYVQLVDHFREISHSLRFAIAPIYKHVNNNHKPFIEEQVEFLREFNSKFEAFLKSSLEISQNEKYDDVTKMEDEMHSMLKSLRAIEKKHIKLVKEDKVSTRNSVLFFDIGSEVKNLLLQTVKLVKSQRDFVQLTKEQ